MLKPFIAVAAFLLTPLALAEQTVDKRMPADAQGEVEVSTTSGQVTVSAWDRNEVQVTGTLDSDDEQLEFTSQPGHISIKVASKKSPGWLSVDDDEADLTIQLPAGSRLNINTVSADIGVKGVRGEQRIQSVSGDISSDLAAEDVEAKTVSGDVLLHGDGKPAVVTVTTVSGDAKVLNAAGEIVATSVSGDLALVLDQITRARVRTTSGDADLEGRLAPDAHVDAETISGDLTFDFKEPVNAEFNAESFSGDINNCSGPKAQPKSEYGPGSRLAFKQGESSAHVRMKTLSGDIRFCAR